MDAERENIDEAQLACDMKRNEFGEFGNILSL